jgi:hypothetical protein
LIKAVKTQKEEIEYLHRTALDRINRYEKTVYAIALISLFLSIGLSVSLSKTITKDGVELTKKALQIEISEKKKVHSEARIFTNCLIHFPLRFIYRPRIIEGIFMSNCPLRKKLNANPLQEPVLMYH